MEGGQAGGFCGIVIGLFTGGICETAMTGVCRADAGGKSREAGFLLWFSVYFPQFIRLPDKAGLFQRRHGDAVGVHNIDAVGIDLTGQIKMIGAIAVVPLFFR